MAAVALEPAQEDVGTRSQLGVDRDGEIVRRKVGDALAERACGRGELRLPGQ